MTLNTLDLLDSGNFQTYNRKIARELGSVNAAIMLSELINRYNYHKDREELLTYKKYEGIWFYYTVEKCEERTVLSRKEQETAIKILEKRGLFTKRSIGIPPKRHFCLNMEEIFDFIGGLKRLFIKPEKGDMNGPKRAERNAPKGPSNKEPYKEPKKNNNPAPPDTPSAVVVFSCLEKIDITQSLRQKISRKYSEEAVERACLVVSAMRPDNLAATLQTALKEEWEPKANKEDIEKQNLQYLHSIRSWEGKKIGHYTIEVSPKYILFRHSRIDGSKDVCYKVDNKGFILSVKSFIEKQI